MQLANVGPTLCDTVCPLARGPLQDNLTSRLGTRAALIVYLASACHADTCTLAAYVLVSLLLQSLLCRFVLEWLAVRCQRAAQLSLTELTHSPVKETCSAQLLQHMG